MASHRNAPSKTVLESQGGSPMSSRDPSDTTPAVPADVIQKLLFFTFAMISLPIGTYFMTVHTIFRGNATYAGALAALMANVVMVGYIIVAMREDQGDRETAGQGGTGVRMGEQLGEGKKAQ